MEHTFFFYSLLPYLPPRGVLEQGYAADIIALKNNPLNDIEAINTIQFVIKMVK